MEGGRRCLSASLMREVVEGRPLLARWLASWMSPRSSPVPLLHVVPPPGCHPGMMVMVGSDLLLLPSTLPACPLHRLVCVVIYYCSRLSVPLLAFYVLAAAASAVHAWLLYPQLQHPEVGRGSSSRRW